MHRMMSPLPLLGGKVAPSRTAHGQNKELTSQEKRYMSNVERAVQGFDSIEEWADYIAVLGRLQKALMSNPDTDSINWIPYDFQISLLLSRCVSQSLPSGVHLKTIELYSIIFSTLKTSNLSGSITLWLPGLLPLMTYASISVKSELINLYNNHICSLDPIVLRSCFKSILLSLLPALDDTTSEFFTPILDLIEKLKLQLDDINHFWSCFLLCVITSSDKRVGAMEYLTKKLPSFMVNLNDVNDKSGTLAELSKDAIACLTPDSGLLIRSFCEAIKDDNLFVQRGFFDLLLTKMPLHSAIYRYLINDADTELLILNVTATALRKDMSLNRRLWNWLLGPESTESRATVTTISRLDYFKEFGRVFFQNSLLRLINDDNDETLLANYIKACKIATSVMDKWEIGQTVLPSLFIPILEKSKKIYDTDELIYETVSKYSNELFDGVENSIIWSKMLKLVQNNDIELILFILKSYNLQEEDMVTVHIPCMLLFSLKSFKNDPKWVVLIRRLISFIPQRALAEPVGEAIEDVCAILESYYQTDFSDVTDSPISSRMLSFNYLTLVTNIMVESLKISDYVIFNKFTQIFDELIKLIPNSSEWDIKVINAVIMEKHDWDSDIDLAFGICNIFTKMVQNLNQLETLKLLKISVKLLWGCFAKYNGNYHVEIVGNIRKYELLMGSSYIEAALTDLLLCCESFQTRLEQFNLLWIHLNHDNYNDSKSILQRPLYLILSELNDDIYSPLVMKWVSSTINTGTLDKLFRIICTKIFNDDQIMMSKNMDLIDFNSISYEIEIINKLLQTDNDEILKAFKLEFCVIDNDKQVEFIKSEEWEISTYKSFLIIIIFRILELKPKNENSHAYLKCIKAVINTLGLLVDGTEPNFDAVTEMIISSCMSNSTRATELFYLQLLMKLVRLSNRRTSIPKVFRVESNEKLISFISTGIFKSHKSIEVGYWIDLILCISEYYPESIYFMSNEIVECICSQVEELIYTQDNGVFLAEEFICELISGMEKILMNCHKHWGYILSDGSRYGLGNSVTGGATSNSSNINKDSGFFGSVIQGVFQVEAAEEKSEFLARKNIVIRAMRRSVDCVYKVWKKCDELLLCEKENQTMIYCCNKIKFRCKKTIENECSMEPLEIVESLISCYFESKNDHEIFKLVQVIDDCSGKLSIMYIIDGINTRLNFANIEENKRSSLINHLQPKKMFEFLNVYIDSIREAEKFEDVWNDVLACIRDILMNPSYYKSVFPFILKFYSQVAVNVLRTEVLKGKKPSKEISDLYIKLMNNCLTLKVSIDNNKVIFREELCNQLRDIISTIGFIITDPDKLNTTVNSIVNGISGYIFNHNSTTSGISTNAASGNISFDHIPGYIVELIETISENENFVANKSFKGFCQDILNEEGFFKITKIEQRKKWDGIMKNWIEHDEIRFEEYLNKLTFASGVSSSGTLLFNWNDEVNILNGNIKYVKRLIYLIMVCEKDQFISFSTLIISKLDQVFKLFRKMTKVCVLERWMLILIRSMFIKFSENHLNSLWTLINKEIYYLFLDVYDQGLEENESGDMDLNSIFLQGCKLIDLLIICSPEEFQLSEWIFIDNSMDGIYQFKEDIGVGIIEKMSKLKGSINSAALNDEERDRKIPLLTRVDHINKIQDLKWFFNMLKIRKYENEYNMRHIDFLPIVDDLFNDIYL